ncbi:MAG: ATP-dependent DNA helicase RecG [Thermoanaerobacteraceae bacterium]|nr:ATP-dependent DNA helicase RecG [Thermoanaerobacteraceae bacterium]
MSNLDLPVRYIKGVGPGREKILNSIGIFNVLDLINYFPRDYENRSVITKIRNMTAGNKVTAAVKYTGRYKILKPHKGLSIAKVYINDDTGYATLTFYNQDYIVKNFVSGQYYLVYGDVDISFGEIQIQNPEVELIKGKLSQYLHIYPIYSLTKNITQKILRSIVKEALTYLDDVKEILPPDLLDRFNLIDIRTAYENIHYPVDMEYLEKAKRRFAFQELFEVMLYLNILKLRRNSLNKGILFGLCDEYEFINSLPFKLTNAQLRVWREIKEDMESDRQMNRLVQGDVGSGKTVIAAIAVYKAVKNNYQAAFMAPTEILAEQHFSTLNALFKGHDINVGLLTGSITPKEKDKMLKDIVEGKIDVVVGTHALIQDNVVFKNLGLVVTDEQHRFGVRQRSMLEQKGSNIDVLVMTATPIPRSLALIIYGDLDISIIDELPPGRKPVKTYLVEKNMRGSVYDFVKSLLKKGEQCYVVAPLIEESDKMDAISVEEVYTELKKEFMDYSVGLLHGKISKEEKDYIMHQFKSNNINLLVSTTVIEVGVDVPNATAIIIENAERFGLAQLHQLRGRIGRGDKESYCFLVMGNNITDVKERLKILTETNDGFKISEHDLKLRGPGDFLGYKQHGLPGFKIANFYFDSKILDNISMAVKYFVDRYGIYSPTTEELIKSIEERWDFSGEEITFN